MFLYFLYYGSAIILIPGIIFAIYAQFRVNSTFKKYDRVQTQNDVCANEVAQMLLDKNGCSVHVQRINGHLTDNYNPKDYTLNLSNSTYGKTSISAVGVAAHEVGHACQHHENHLLLKLRMAIVPAVNIGSMLAFPLAILGILIEYVASVATFGTVLIALGIVLYSLSTIFALITLPVELNASRRAEKMLTEGGYITSSERKKVRAVLSAAALTYFASLVVSLLYLLRFLIIIGRMRKD